MFWIFTRFAPDSDYHSVAGLAQPARCRDLWIYYRHACAGIYERPYRQLAELEPQWLAFAKLELRGADDDWDVRALLE